MNLLQRLVLVIVLVIVGLIVTVILIQPDLIARLDSAARLILAVLIDLILLGVLAVLLRRQRVTNETALMVRASGAVADVSVASARERILRAVRSVPGVISAEAKVEAVRSRANVELDVMVAGANINVPQKQKEIDRALRQVIQKQLGLQMAHKPRVHIQLEPETPPARVEPLAPPPPPVATVTTEVIALPVETKPAAETRDINDEPDFMREKIELPSLPSEPPPSTPEKPAAESEPLIPAANNAHRDSPPSEDEKPAER